MSVASDAAAPAYKDRTTGLVLLGLLEIVIGLCALAGAGLSSMAMFFAPAMPGASAPQGGGQIAFGVAFYLVIAAFFITMGIGSLLARRWARALMLVASWAWLALGVLTLVGLVFLLPMMRSMMSTALEQAAAQQPGSASSPDPAFLGAVMVGCSIAFIVLLQIVLPAIFVLFYRSPHVRATCEARDARSRWTDRLPLPVLSFVLFHGFGALGILGSVLAYGAFAVFGHIVTGAWAWLLAAVFTFVLALATWWAWRLDVRGWWLGVGVGAFGVASAVGTLLHPLDWDELYRAMGIDPSVVAPLDLEAWADKFGWLTLVAMLPWIGYLLWVRRSFAPPAPARGAFGA
jgi:hypothetical protein